MIIHWNDIDLTCAKAVRNHDSIELYDENDNFMNKIEQISHEEWNHISMEEGFWSDRSEIKTPEQKLREENAALRADLDYCLMLLEE